MELTPSKVVYYYDCYELVYYSVFQQEQCKKVLYHILEADKNAVLALFSSFNININTAVNETNGLIDTGYYLIAASITDPKNILSYNEIEAGLSEQLGGEAEYQQKLAEYEEGVNWFCNNLDPYTADQELLTPEYVDEYNLMVVKMNSLATELNVLESSLHDNPNTF